VTEEKEEMTLGLLKMSGLNSVAILLGKSTSRLTGAVLLLLAQFPFTLLAVTLGGVSLRQIFAAYATLLAYLVLLANFALMVSVCSRRTLRAAAVTGVLLIAFLIAGPIGVNLLPMSSPRFKATVTYALLDACAGGCQAANPLARIGQIMASGFDGHPLGVQVVSNLALGGFFFVVAWLLFGAFTREQKAAAPARGVVARRSGRLRWIGISRTWRRPIAWKDFHFLAGGRFMIVVRFAGLLLLVLFFAWMHEATGEGPPPADFIGGVLIIGSLIIAALEIISYVARMYQCEVRWHTLSELMLLPMSKRRITLDMILGLLPALIPYAVAFLIGVLLAPAGFSEAIEEILGSSGGWYAIIQYVAFLHFVAFMSLVFKRTGAIAALGMWIVGNWIISMFFFMLFPFMGASGPDVFCFLMSLVYIGLMVVMYVGISARLDKLAGQ